VTILAVDTTSEFGGVTIRRDGGSLVELQVHAPGGFAHVLFQSIDQALASARLDLNEIDCFAAASGPGSFTGVRVGLSAVKGLACAQGKPAIGVSNLKALALFGNLPMRATVLNARRSQAYAAIYDASLKPVVPESVVKLSDWLDSLDIAECEFITAAGSPFRASLDAMQFRDMPWTEVAPNLAPAVAKIAEQSEWVDPAVLDANYVRRSDTELFWKDDR
jgi:tRNA threonylcarbamoyladenosine biosynthesis protein TsaB